MSSSPTVSSSTRPATHRIVQQLQEQIRQCERQGSHGSAQIVSSGFAALDEILPAGGLRRGTLAEWLAARPGSGASLLALVAASQASRQRGRTIIVDRHGRFNPLPALALGISPASLVVVRPQNVADELWAIDQALRCRGVGAVVAWPERVSGHAFRRLQLAVEASGALGSLVRPASARSEPTWADVRLGVEPQASHRGWRIRVELLRSHAGRQDGMAELIVNEQTYETNSLLVGRELADSTSSARIEALPRATRAV